MRKTTGRYVRHGATPDERLRHRGWDEVITRPDLGPCWVWRGAKGYNGYGRVACGPGSPVSTHRLAYQTWVGPIPDGHCICHRCDNPPCINPAHLFTGTTADNQRDMRAKGRRIDPVKLSDADVMAIRAAYTGKRGEQTMLAGIYDVSLATISLIVRGLHRANV